MVRIMKRAWRLAVLCGVIVVVYIVSQIKFTVTPRTLSRGFLVESSACRILDLDPYDSSISNLIKFREKFECSGLPSITYEDIGMIRINRTNVKSYKDFKYCRYQPILRGPEQSDFQFSFGEFSKPFSSDITVTENAVKVKCFNKYDEMIYLNAHSLIIPNGSLDKLQDQRHRKFVAKHQPKEVLNVLMVGIDTMSRLNSIRQMPLTRRVLTEELGAVEMLGYNKVALNTYVNIIPMTTGMFQTELPNFKDIHFHDNISFIWKNFTQNGYRTLYAEDCPKFGIFTYLKPGFLNPPTDHYNRAFSDAIEGDREIWNGWHHCVGDRLETEVALNYLKDFTVLYRQKPRFSFTFLTRLTHDDINFASVADGPHHRFIRRIHSEGFLNNTVMFYFSDHGMRYGSLRETNIGKMEDRLPFMYVYIPTWMRVKYPHIYTNLRRNSRRLSTPFDVYETLKDVLDFKGRVYHIGNVSKRGISLFNEIPSERSCDQAGIESQWCVCLDNQPLPVDLPEVRNASKTIVAEVNRLLKGVADKCAYLKLKEIKSASGLNQHDLDPKNWKDWSFWFPDKSDIPRMFQVSIVTTPGDALFEATFVTDEVTKQLVISGQINRINKYGNQSACINDYVLRNYCFCV